MLRECKSVCEPSLGIAFYGCLYVYVCMCMSTVRISRICIYCLARTHNGRPKILSPLLLFGLLLFFVSFFSYCFFFSSFFLAVYNSSMLRVFFVTVFSSQRWWTMLNFFNLLHFRYFSKLYLLGELSRKLFAIFLTYLRRFNLI